MPNHSVFLREIAEAVGFSRMTVSLALRGKPGVSAATRKQVLAVANELGFRPDPLISKFMSHIRSGKTSGLTACLALLSAGSVPDEWRRYTTERKYVEGVEARAGEYGYRVEHFWLNEPGMTEKRLENIIWSRGIEGIVIGPMQGRLERSGNALDFDFHRFSVVAISETFDRPDLDRALHDQYTSMLKVISELMAGGSQRIGLVIEEQLDARTNWRWTAAYLRCCEHDRTNRILPPLILSSPDEKSFGKWFDKHRPETVVSVNRFGSNLLKLRGFTIPGEVGYVSLDLDDDGAEDDNLCGIDQNSCLVGAAAVDMLVGAIQRGQRGIPLHPRRVEVEGTWHLGRSMRKVPAA